MISKVIGATVLASALLFGTGAQSMPAASRTTHKRSRMTDLIQVRDGCGAGRHFSPALGRCVVNYGVYGAAGLLRRRRRLWISRRCLSWRRLIAAGNTLIAAESTAVVEWAIAEDIVAGGRRVLLISRHYDDLEDELVLAPVDASIVRNPKVRERLLQSGVRHRQPTIIRINVPSESKPHFIDDFLHYASEYQPDPAECAPAISQVGDPDELICEQTRKLNPFKLNV